MAHGGGARGGWRTGVAHRGWRTGGGAQGVAHGGRVDGPRAGSTARGPGRRPGVDEPAEDARRLRDGRAGRSARPDTGGGTPHGEERHLLSAQGACPRLPSAGEVCPPAGRTRGVSPRSDHRAVGPPGPRLKCFSGASTPAPNTSRRPPHSRARGSSHVWDPAARLTTRAINAPQESPMTTTLAPEPKTTIRRRARPGSRRPRLAARIPVGPDATDVVPASRPDRRPSSSSTSPSASTSTGASPRSSRSTTSRSAWSAGTIHGILGANGSGKSTLIRLISGLLTLDEGRVEVFGHDIERDELAVKRLINRVSVDAAFFKKLSPMENLLFAARLYGLDAGRARREATAILARLGIAESRLGRPVEQMSRGMQQKVAIARALLTSPTLLLLDEPTTGLDPRSKLDVQAFVEEVNADARRHDRPHDARPGRGGAPLRPHHDPRRGSGGRRGLARRAQATRRRASRATADPRRRVHDLYGSLPRRGRRGR